LLLHAPDAQEELRTASTFRFVTGVGSTNSMGGYLIPAKFTAKIRSVYANPVVMPPILYPTCASVYTSNAGGTEGCHSDVPKRLSITWYAVVGEEGAEAGAGHLSVAEVASCITSSGTLGVSDGPEIGVKRTVPEDWPRDR
jgi:hypothetical protein